MKFSLAKSARLRSTPFTELIESYGVESYTVYNHMLLPASFKGLVEDYEHLKKSVQLWDVSGERQVQIKGPDASRLIQLITCRDLSSAQKNICYYCPIVDEKGKILNDPLLMKISDDTWWVSIADSDVLLYAKGLSLGLKLQCEITEPNINPLAVQGPFSFDLMQRIFGEEILNLKFFHFQKFLYQKHPLTIARSGWSKQGGFEIYVDSDDLGVELFKELMIKGQDLDVRPGCPNLIERIEGGLLSYGNDMDMRDTPLECGLERFVSFNPNIQYLGKEYLLKQSKEGIQQSLIGLKLERDHLSITKHLPIYYERKKIGELRSGCYSPTFKCCLAIAMIKTNHQIFNEKINLTINNEVLKTQMIKLPFLK